jgi:hypothetical protein
MEKILLAGKKLLCKEGYSNFKFKICQSYIDLKKTEFLIKASLTDFKFRIR